MKKLFSTFLLTMLFLPLTVNAQAEGGQPAAMAEKSINVYIFTQQGCPHCARTLAYLEELKKTEYPQLMVTEFDLKIHPEYFQKYVQFATALNVYSSDWGVPVTFVGDKVVFGELLSDIRAAIETSKVKNSRDTEDIVNDYVKAHPELNPAPVASTSASVIGWVVIGVVGIAVLVLVINKLL